MFVKEICTVTFRVIHELSSNIYRSLQREKVAKKAEEAVVFTEIYYAFLRLPNEKRKWLYIVYQIMQIRKIQIYE